MQELVCPKCRHVLETPVESETRPVRCPACGRPVQWDEVGAEGPDVAKATGNSGEGSSPDPSASRPVEPNDPHAGESSGPTRRSPVIRRRVQTDRSGASPSPATRLEPPRSVGPMALGLFAGAVLFIALYLVETRLGVHNPVIEKLLHRGWTPYAAVFLTLWSLAILALKAIRTRRRRAALEFQLIPTEIDVAAEGGVKAVIERFRRADLGKSSALLKRRIIRALDRYQVSGSIQGVVEVLEAESDADYEEYQSSYTLVRAFLWTIPILGFIGTVVGVGKAVGGFGSFLAEAQEIEQVKQALGGVTANLGLAFDTTLVALVLSVLVMITLSGVERMEGNLLQAYDDYGREQVVRGLAAVSGRQRIEPDGPSISALLERLPSVLEEAVHRAVVRAVPGVEFWGGEARQLAEELARSVAEPWDRAQQSWVEQFESFRGDVAEYYQQHLALVQETGAQWRDLRDAIEGRLPGLRTSLDDATTAQYQATERQVRAFGELAERIEQLLHLHRSLARGVEEAGGSDGFAELAGDLRQTLSKLDRFLERVSNGPLDMKLRLSTGSVDVVQE